MSNDVAFIAYKSGLYANTVGSKNCNLWLDKKSGWVQIDESAVDTILDNGTVIFTYDEISELIKENHHAI